MAVLSELPIERSGIVYKKLVREKLVTCARDLYPRLFLSHAIPIIHVVRECE